MNEGYNKKKPRNEHTVWWKWGQCKNPNISPY